MQCSSTGDTDSLSLSLGGGQSVVAVRSLPQLCADGRIEGRVRKGTSGGHSESEPAAPPAVPNPG